MMKKNHNHTATLADAHSTHRKIAMTNAMKNEISRNLRIQISFTRIIFNLRVTDSITEISFADFSNPEMINLMFKPRDIYNMKTQLRREFFGPLTSMQALIKEFDEND